MSESDERGREQNAAEREAELDRREAALAARTEAVQEILEAAEARDIHADERDGVADKLDHDADRAAFMNQTDQGYGTDSPARRHAALDRGFAKADRSSAADDREKLTKPVADPDDTATA